MKPNHQQHLSTLEQGFGVTSTKLGPGEKLEGYAITKTRAKWFLGGIFAALIILAILVGVYAGMFNDERVRRMFLQRQSMEKISDQKVEAMRLGIAIHQQHSEREHIETDTRRALKRIMSVIGRKFDELIDDMKDKTQVQKLVDIKTTLTDFVNDELKDFEKENELYDVEAKKRLEKLATLQEQSLRDLLKSVSGVKLEALEDMLQDVFEAAEKAPDISASESTLEDIEDLADSLYEGTTTLQDGRAQLKEMQKKITGQIPAQLLKSFDDAADADSFAEALDELVDDARLARGKKEIEMIRDNWKRNLDRAQQNDDNNSQDEDEDTYDEEIKVNVDTVLAIHKLVAEGKVPVHLLDFEALDMNDDDKTQQQNQDQQEGEVQGRQTQDDGNREADEEENKENELGTSEDNKESEEQASNQGVEDSINSAQASEENPS